MLHTEDTSEQEQASIHKPNPAQQQEHTCIHAHAACASSTVCSNKLQLCGQTVPRSTRHHVIMTTKKEPCALWLAASGSVYTDAPTMCTRNMYMFRYRLLADDSCCSYRCHCSRPMLLLLLLLLLLPLPLQLFCGLDCTQQTGAKHQALSLRGPADSNKRCGAERQPCRAMDRAITSDRWAALQAVHTLYVRRPYLVHEGSSPCCCWSCWCCCLCRSSAARTAAANW